MNKPQIAPDGAVWCCPACGRQGKDRYAMGDSSCSTWASLIVEGSVRPGPDGGQVATPWKEQDNGAN